MYKILTLNSIADIGLKELPKENFETATEEKSPDGVLLRSYDMHEMELPTTLKAIARAGAGVNNIPIDKCSERGIVVFNTPGANANAVKELVIAGLLLSSRKIADGILWANGLKGQKDVAKQVEKGKSAFVGPEILGKKLGVIGLGAIGVMVANTAHSLGMEVMGFDPFISVDAAWGISRSITKAASLETLFAECDYITVHIPLNDKTKNMFDKTAFNTMKKGVRLLNFSRGELVCFADVKEALESGQVACYVTDFPTEDILELPNVVAIPHLGASTPESEDNCAVMAAIELRDYLELGNIKNSVNFPDVELANPSKVRITLAHKNIPNIVSPVTNVLAHYGINIDNMINKSKGKWAYTIIDTDDIKNKEVKAELEAIDGIVAVRVIKQA